MRLLPPIPVNARIANKDTWLPAGGGPEGKDSLLVKKGQPLVLSTWGAGRHAQNFGDDALAFRPERWDDLATDTPGFLPFLIGPRTCSGRKWFLPSSRRRRGREREREGALMLETW